jgi:hypothetical protein
MRFATVFAGLAVARRIAGKTTPVLVATVARRLAGDFPRSGERGYERNTEVVIPTILSTALSAADDRSNILFIMSDDHCARAVGAYGLRLAALNPTPNLDALARGGMLFENVFCTNSICTPSRASILTGQYSLEREIPVRDTEGHSSDVLTDITIRNISSLSSLSRRT